MSSFNSVNTNFASLMAQRILKQNQQTLTTSLERLSTGLRINRGKDDPAGLIASEFLRLEQTSLQAAISNAQRADQVVNVAEGALVEVSSLLAELESLVGSSANDAGITQSEKEAYQLQIDNILQAIDHIANTTTFLGSKLFSGTYDYQLAGVNASELTDVRVHQAKIADDSQINVSVRVTQSAQTGQVFFDTGGAIAGSAVSIEVAGNIGIQQFTFASGTTAVQIASAVNAFSKAIGVSASVTGTEVRFDSSEVGNRQFVSVAKVSGNSAYDSSFGDTSGATSNSSALDYGQNAGVTINGITAQVDGVRATISQNNLALEVRLDVAFAQTVGNASTFSVEGDGAKFNLAPDVNLGSKVSLALPTLTTGRLGSNATGRLADLRSGGTSNVVDGDLTTAQKIVREVVDEVAKLRGRLGSFQNTVIQSTIRSLGVTLENVTAAESQIRDTDFAKETAELTRAQILSSASASALAIANALPKNILNLLSQV